MRPFPTLLVMQALALAGCVTQPGPAAFLTADHPCLPWVDFPADRYSNADSPFYGCTAAVNLRAMAVEPGDLDAGRPLGPANGDQQVRAVDAYRLGRVKAFQGAGASGTTAGGSSGAASGTSSGSGP